MEVLPARIEELEAEQQKLYETMADQTFYQGDGTAVARAKARLEEIEGVLAADYRRNPPAATPQGARSCIMAV